MSDLDKFLDQEIGLSLLDYPLTVRTPIDFDWGKMKEKWDAVSRDRQIMQFQHFTDGRDT